MVVDHIKTPLVILIAVHIFDTRIKKMKASSEIPERIFIIIIVKIYDLYTLCTCFQTINNPGTGLPW